MTDSVAFDDLATADLVLERVYKGGNRGNASDDVIGKLLPVGNQGGFRFAGRVTQGTVKLAVLYTSGSEVDWPDEFDPTTGDFAYYGDNRKPGRELHDTPRNGNRLLRDIFDASRKGPVERLRIPPLLLFEKTGSGRDVRFRGLLAPGSPRLRADEELVAVWRTTGDLRFQNYRAHLTVLQTPVVTRQWLDSILAGDSLGAGCPREWDSWVRSRIYRALEAPRTVVVRSRAEQVPDEKDRWMIDLVHQYFSPDPVRFEYFAADMWLAFDRHATSVEVTRPSRDGGRDAVGEYSIGPLTDPVKLEFALEAKCFSPSTSVGVRAVSRLVSRIKHREFGVFVTTSFIAAQAYQEIREDGHPIVFVTGRDIVEVLKRLEVTTPASLRKYLHENHPVVASNLTTDQGHGEIEYVSEHGERQEGTDVGVLVSHGANGVLPSRAVGPPGC